MVKRVGLLVALCCMVAVLASVLLAPREVPAAQSASAKYVGAKKCKMCHIKEYKTWSKTGMATAYERIADAPDKELCVPCHTTGHGKAAVDGVTPEKLQGVQCESCHGPGSEHLASGKDKAEKKATITTSSATCGECHTPHVRDKAEKVRGG